MAKPAGPLGGGRKILNGCPCPDRARTRHGQGLRGGSRGRISERADVLGLRALLALRDVELDLLALEQLAEALGVDVREVGEDVRAATLLLDEAEALFRVEPLHGAS